MSRLLAILCAAGLALSTEAFAGENPCSKNPCAQNPCGKNSQKPIRSEKAPDMKKLVKLGEKLWNDPNLGKVGLSCMNCHADYENLNLDKKASHTWPHLVKMPADIYTFDQMVNFCMINPMATEPLDRNSVEMTAMATYYNQYLKGYKKQ